MAAAPQFIFADVRRQMLKMRPRIRPSLHMLVHREFYRDTELLSVWQSFCPLFYLGQFFAIVITGCGGLPSSVAETFNNINAEPRNHLNHLSLPACVRGSHDG
jgi:hypothetical protein